MIYKIVHKNKIPFQIIHFSVVTALPLIISLFWYSFSHNKTLFLFACVLLYYFHLFLAMPVVDFMNHSNSDRKASYLKNFKPHPQAEVYNWTYVLCLNKIINFMIYLIICRYFSIKIVFTKPCIFLFYITRFKYYCDFNSKFHISTLKYVYILKTYLIRLYEQNYVIVWVTPLFNGSYTIYFC